MASVVGDIAELQRIAVEPAAGAGSRRAARRVVAGPKADGAERLLLEVREDNAGALAFYAAAGFVEIDRRPRYYRDGATAVVHGAAADRARRERVGHLVAEAAVDPQRGPLSR